MDAPGKVPDSINCHACGALIDLAGQTGFTHIECPRCEALSVVPLQFGNFLLLNPIGIGGMGTVYRAVDLSLNRYLAVKILRKKMASNPEFIEKFAREARAAAAVNHPNIAQVYSFGEHEGQYYLAMELLERGSLDDRIMKQGQLDEKTVLSIGVQIASGLRAAFQRNLLHRDVKPGNILFNDQNVPKLVDFGLARVRSREATQPIAPQAGATEPIWGTPYYIAPEKLRGHADDFRSDIYSLGATLFHALAGRPPFEAATADEVVSKQATQPAYSLKTYAPTTLDYTAHVFARMLAKNPAERYASYDELITDLQEAQRMLKAAESTKTIVAPTGERIAVGSLVGAVVTLIACGIIVWLAWVNRGKLFGLESAAPQAPPPTAAATAAPQSTAAGSAPAGESASETPAPAADEVDFTEDAPWVKAWNVATLQLTQGRYTDALLGYDSALQLVGRARPRHRQWIYYYQGLALLAADRPSESLAVFLKAIDPRGGKTIPDTITTANFVNLLARTMLEEIPLPTLEAEIGRMPPWAAALTSLSAGFKHLNAGEFAQAAEAFRRYHNMDRDDGQRWAFNLQPLAERLARDCDAAARTLAEIDSLEKQQKFDEALTVARATAAKTSITALKAAMLTLDSQLQKSNEQYQAQLQRTQLEQARLQQQRDQEEQKRAAEEARAIQTVEASLAATWQNYDFNGALAKYAAAAEQVQTENGRRAIQQRQSAIKLLVELKQQLAADFARAPYDGANLRTRSNAPFSGRLTRATDSQLIFATPYGEVAANWRDLPPAEWVKLADSYIATLGKSEATEAVARRCLRLAVFCKQYGMERAAANYAQRATQTLPALQREVDVALGKPPG